MPLSCFSFGGGVFFRRKFRRCPHCGERIRKEAIKCRFCGRFLADDTESRNACVACRVMIAACALILLVWLAVFIWQSGLG